VTALGRSAAKEGKVPKIDGDSCSGREKDFMAEEFFLRRRKFVIAPVAEIRIEADRKQFQIPWVVQGNSLNLLVFEDVPAFPCDAALLYNISQNNRRTRSVRRFTMSRVAWPSISSIRSPTSIRMRVPSFRTRASRKNRRALGLRPGRIVSKLLRYCLSLRAQVLNAVFLRGP